MLEATSELLRLIQYRVDRDQNCSGLSGSICLGVEVDDGQFEFWYASFGRAVSAAFVPELRPADGVLVLGKKEARSVMGQKVAGSGSDFVKVFGDRALMIQFFRRYLQKGSVLSLRSRKASPA